jgi:sulfate adenylyltransferase
VTPSGQLAAPVVQLSDHAVADLQLVLDGVVLPWSTLGGTAAGSVGSRRPSSADSGAADLVVPSPVAVDALVAERVVLADREQTPIAELTDLSGAPTGAPGAAGEDVVLTGKVRPLRAREARLFLDHAVPGGHLPLPAPGAPRHAIVVGRPLLTADVARATATLAGGGDLVVLVPVEGPTADGVPPVTLMRSVLQVATALGPATTIVAAPIHWRDAASDAALALAVGAAYGAESTELLTGGPEWSDLLTGLDGGDQLPEVAAPGVLAELRRWRPVPSERGAMILFTGFSGSGKSTLARDLAAHLVEGTPRTVSLLDGDDVRRLLSSGLGFDRAGRDLNVRRIGFVGSEIARHGGLAICAPIAPYAESRAAVRAMVEPVGDFVLIHVSTPLEECERRDLKGLYAKARAGLIPEFTGVSDPYDVPTDADLAVDTSQVSRETALDQVLALLRTIGLIDNHPTLTTADPE